MNIARERKSINAALDSYRAQLDTIPDDRFTETPPGGGWSYAEVYSHILNASLGSSIALERCTHNNCAPSAKGMTLFGRFLMVTGIFPKVKVPQTVADKIPSKKISKEDAKNLIVKCRKRMEATSPLIADSSPDAKHQHPRLGMLNASQWFKFIRIHLNHHLKQLARIAKKFQNN